MRANGWFVRIAVVLAACGGLAACSDGDGGTSTGHAAGTASRIATGEPSERTFATRVPWVGTVEARESVRLVALVAGRVEEVAVADQTAVASGAALFRLGGPRVKAEHERLKARVDSVRSQVAALEGTVHRLEPREEEEQSMQDRLAALVDSRRDLAAQTAERTGKSVADLLATRNQQAAARDAELAREEDAERDRQDGVRRQQDAADALAAARDVLARRRDDLRDAEAALAAYETALVVAAPGAGLFTDRRVSPGQEIRPGEELGEVVDPVHRRVVAALFAPPGAALAGRPVTVRLTGGRTVTGTVTSVLPDANEDGATVVWVEGPEIDADLRPGETAGGELVLVETAPSLAVPESALVYDEGEHTFVFVARGDGYDRVPVDVGRVADGWAEIRSGIDKGAKVVTRGAYELLYRQFDEQFQVED